MLTELALRESQERLFFAYRSFTSAPDAILSKRGWTRVHHRIMHFIARNPGITVSGLLDKLQVTKQALHAPLKTLIAEEIAVTAVHEADRRIKKLFLTDYGLKLEATLSAPQLALLDRAFAQCTPQQLDDWHCVMNAIIEAETAADGK